MANKEQQIKNSLIYLLPVGVSSLLPLLTLPIFTRILTVEEYGVLALAQIYAIVVTGVANFGMTVSFDRNYFQHRESRLETAQLLYSIVCFVCINFIFLMFITYLYGGTIARHLVGTAEYKSFLFLVCCAHFCGNVSYYYFTFLRNSERAQRFSVSTIAGSLINTLLALFFVAYMQIGIVGIVYAQLWSGVLVCMYLAYQFGRAHPFSVDAKIFLEALRIAYPLTPRVFFSVIDKQFDKYMIGFLASLGEVGIYSIGQKISYIIFTFMTAIENVFSPQVYQMMFDFDDKQARLAIGKYITPYIYISILTALLIALFSEEIVFLLAPPAYYAASDIVSVLALFYGFLFWGKVNSLQLIYKRKTYVTSILTLLSIGLNIALNIPFISEWGAVGAAWATVLAGIISGMITFCVAQSVYKIEWRYPHVALIFGTFFVASISLIVLKNMEVEYVICLGAKIVAVCVYGGFGVRVGVVTAENLAVLKKMLRELPCRKALKAAVAL